MKAVINFTLHLIPLPFFWWMTMRDILSSAYILVFFPQCSNWLWTQLQQCRWTFRMLLSECNCRLGVEREVWLSIWGWVWLNTRQVWCIQKFIFINCWKTASWGELNHRSRGLFILQNVYSKGLSFVPATHDFLS